MVIFLCPPFCELRGSLNKIRDCALCSGKKHLTGRWRKLMLQSRELKVFAHSLRTKSAFSCPRWDILEARKFTLLQVKYTGVVNAWLVFFNTFQICCRRFVMWPSDLHFTHRRCPGNSFIVALFSSLLPLIRLNFLCVIGICPKSEWSIQALML